MNIAEMWMIPTSPTKLRIINNPIQEKKEVIKTKETHVFDVNHGPQAIIKRSK